MIIFFISWHSLQLSVDIYSSVVTGFNTYSQIIGFVAVLNKTQNKQKQVTHHIRNIT